MSSLRIYSPISAWWKHTVVSGSVALHSAVDRAVTPKPNGKSLIEYTTTPWCFGVFSVIRPRPALVTWFPYKNCCSADVFNQTLYLVVTQKKTNMNWLVSNEFNFHLVYQKDWDWLWPTSMSMLIQSWNLLCIRCQVVECCDIKLEFVGLWEFAHATAHVDESVSSEIFG